MGKFDGMKPGGWRRGPPVRCGQNGRNGWESNVL